MTMKLFLGKSALGQSAIGRIGAVIVLLFGLMMGPIYASEKTELVFGVVPQQSAAKLAKQWQPLIDAWGEQTGVSIRFATARDIPTFEQRLTNGDYDIAYMNPYHFTLVNQTPGYTAIAKAKDKKITGIIVAQKGWDGQLQDFNDKQMAFPAPRAFAATIINQSELTNQGVIIEPKYVGSHDSVYLSVARGLYPAGGGVSRTFNSLPSETRDKLEVIYKTAGYTPHAIAVSNSVSPEVIDALQQALLALDDDSKANQSYQMLKIKGLEPAQDSDWNDVVELGISL